MIHKVLIVCCNRGFVSNVRTRNWQGGFKHSKKSKLNSKYLRCSCSIGILQSFRITPSTFYVSHFQGLILSIIEANLHR